MRTATSAAPLRVSLAGGGTDLPSYAATDGGDVLALAIDRYVAVTSFPRSFSNEVSVRCHGPAELVEHVSDVRHPFVRAVLGRADVQDSLQLTSSSDAPAGSGLGGSGAFLVAALAAVRASLRARAEPPDRVALAEAASAVEMQDLERPVGKQDHYMAALGGLQHLRIDPDQHVEAYALAVSPVMQEYFAHRLLLFHTGEVRDAGVVLQQQADEVAARPETRRRLRAIHDLVPPMTTALRQGDTASIGPLLAEHWVLKAGLRPSPANQRADEMLKAATRCGSDGGKIVGAGQGGFLLVSCLDGRAGAVRRVLTDGYGLRELPFAAAPVGVRTVSIGM